MATALLIVDMQRAYFNNSALEKDRDRLVEACNELIRSAQQHNLAIFAIRTEHTEDKATWTLNMLDDGTGYLYEGSTDVQHVEGLESEGTIELTKTRDSAFFETNLLSMLRTKHIDHIILCGVSTHSCIMMTAADAYAANMRVTLADEAIASHDPSFHKSTLTMLEQEYRQKVADNKTIIGSME